MTAEFDTYHHLLHGDSRNLSAISDDTVHLAVTSPPVWTGTTATHSTGSLRDYTDYDKFLTELSKVWSEIYRILVPGGRLVCVVGDIWLSRKKYGRHSVIPFPSDICLTCRDIGFENLNPIIWHKVPAASDKSRERSRFLGKPYGPNGIIKNEIDYILMQRKPGGYRKPTKLQRKLSKIGKYEYNRWFQQFWNLQNDSPHSPVESFPHEIADRLIRMFSFWGDTVIDPFCRAGTTLVAAMRCERNSIGVETDKKFCRIAINRLHEASSPLFCKTLPDLLELSAYSPPAPEPENE